MGGVLHLLPPESQTHRLSDNCSHNQRQSKQMAFVSSYKIKKRAVKEGSASIIIARNLSFVTYITEKKEDKTSTHRSIEWLVWWAPAQDRIPITLPEWRDSYKSPAESQERMNSSLGWKTKRREETQLRNQIASSIWFLPVFFFLRPTQEYRDFFFFNWQFISVT